MAVVCLLAAAVSGWVWLERPQGLAPAQPVAKRPVPAATAAPALSEAAASVAAGPAAPPAPAPAPAPALPQAMEAVWDLCGIGRLPMPAGVAEPEAQAELPPHLGTAALEEARARLLAALRQGKPRARAAALVLEDLPQAAEPAASPSLGSLRAGLELAGDDPVALRWAAARCGGQACAREAAERWVKLEPDNASAWLTQLAIRGARRDDDSLRPLWAARRFQAHWGAPTDTVRQAMPPDVPPYLQVGLLLQAMGRESALWDGGYMLAAELCRAPVAGERRAGCAALGSVMQDHGDTLLAAMVGLRLREAAGLDPAAANSLRKGLQDLSSSGGLPFDLTQPLSCESVRRLHRWVEVVGREGELAALRAAAAASSPTPYSASPPQSR